MKQTILYIILLFIPDSTVTNVLTEINTARANPSIYGTKYNLDLRYIEPSNPLELDEDLSIDCYNWALEMANTNTLKHDYSDDNNESVAVTPNINNLVNIFIIDKNIPDLGHRHHLLAHGSSYKDDTNIGIGIVYSNNKYWIVIRTN